MIIIKTPWDACPQWRSTYIIWELRSTPARLMTYPNATHIKDEVDAPETTKLSISKDEKETILINVEAAVRNVIINLAKRNEIEGIDIENEIVSALPTSYTGILIHYFTKGLKEDFNIEFEEQPVSLKVRGGSMQDRKVSGKKRLLTKEEKNELLAKMQMSYYESDMMTGKMTIDEVMTNIKTAFEEKKRFEDMGYMLPTKKNEAPYWENKE